MSTDYHFEQEYKDHGPRPYSYEVKLAVRYAYQYRAAADEKTTQFICWLPELPGVFCWLTEQIFAGVAYDVFKWIVKNTFEYLKRHRRKIDPVTKRILTDPVQIQRFYDYIRDFMDKNPNISEKEKKGIVEGIIADYTKTEAEKIYNSTGRFPTDVEYHQILKKADDLARMIISDWFSFQGGGGRDNRDDSSLVSSCMRNLPQVGESRGLFR